MKRSLALLLSLLFVQVITSAGWAAPYTATWTSRWPTEAGSGYPGARSWVDIIYDPVIQRTVLFGGSASAYRNDILNLSVPLNQWTLVEPYTKPQAISPPCGRDEHAVEFDAYNRFYWSFGGSGYDCATFNSFAQSGSTTTSIVDTGLAATTDNFYRDWIVSVSGSITYYAYVTAYDAAAKRLTLATSVPILTPGKGYTLRAQFGGGTWRYNPATRQWKGFEAPSFGYTGAKPPSRLSPAFAYSTRDTALVMFGGVPYNDTWALDSQTQTWVRMLPDGNAGSPPARAQMTNSMVYDSVNDVFVLFGGRCADSGNIRCTYNSTLGDTWTYRLSTNTWTKMNPAVSPSPRQQQQMAFDPVNAVVVMYGGQANNATFYGDVWVYNAATNTWTQVPTPAVNPGARRIGSMTYDPSIGQFVLYGGLNAAQASQYGIWTLKITDQGGGTPPPVDVFVTGLTLTGSVVNGNVTQVLVNGSPASFTTGANGAYTVSIPVSASGTLSIAITASGASGTKTETVTVSVP